MSLVEPNSGTSTPLESTQSESETNCDLPRKKLRKGGLAFNKVWDYVIKGEKVNPRHYKAECFHCEMSWQRGRPYVLRSHLALYCQNVPEDIRRYWVNKLAEENNSHKRDSQLQ
ncbi:19687_t:CDS:1, partial [Cetraspora pellucida]